MPRRLLTLLSAISLLAFVMSDIMWLRSYHPQSAATPSTARMQMLLSRRIPAISFPQLSFTDTVDFFRDVSGARIDVDWPALSAAGVKPDTIVSLALTNQRLGQVLTQIISTNTQLIYYTDANAIRISTKSAPKNTPIPPSPSPRSLLPTRPLPPQPRPTEAVLGSHRYTLTAHRGILRLWISPPDPASVYQSGLPSGNATAPDSQIPFDFAGFSLRHGDSPFLTWVVGVPFWALTILTILPPLLLWFRSTRRRRYRLRHNLCPTCSYDLRASKDICPECGSPIPQITNNQ